MSTAGSVSVDELVRALERKSASLPAEIAAFIAFSGCESMVEQGPRELATLAQVRVTEQGSVVLTGAPCEEEAGARSLHRVLTKLLQAVGSNLPPALQRLLARPEQDVRSLAQLHDDLEATLVPLNRTASRRVLARFARETAYRVIDAQAVGAALNSLLGDEEPANDAPGKERTRSLEPETRLQVDLLEGLDLENEDAHYLERTISLSAPSLERDSVRPSTRPSLAPSAGPSFLSLPASSRSHASQLEELGSPRGTRKLFIGFALVALAVLIVIVAVSLRDERARQERLRAEELAAAAALDKPVQAAAAGDLLVHVSEPNAQVLRLLGRAPISVDNLPLGVAHEFVATAEGHRPARVLVPANADWESTPEGARYELALQLNPVEPAGQDVELELGPSRFTAQAAEPATGHGSIRVVTTPKAARVYQLVGFSPDVKVTNLPLDVAQEVLIYREGFTPVLRALQPSDFRSAGGKRTAELTVQLVKPRR